MTWSLTLAGLPRAGANSKPHHYKQKVQKMKGLSVTLNYVNKTITEYALASLKYLSQTITPLVPQITERTIWFSF